MSIFEDPIRFFTDLRRFCNAKQAPQRVQVVFNELDEYPIKSKVELIGSGTFCGEQLYPVARMLKAREGDMNVICVGF